MKKLTALILALITLLGASLTARADGAISDSWKGEVISMQVSLYNQASSSSGSSRKVKNGEEFYILSREGNWFYVAVPNDNGSYDYGYVMSYYVVENPTHIVLRNANGIYAYAAPYNTDKRVGTVSSYQRFTVIATTGTLKRRRKRLMVWGVRPISGTITRACLPALSNGSRMLR